MKIKGIRGTVVSSVVGISHKGKSKLNYAFITFNKDSKLPIFTSGLFKDEGEAENRMEKYLKGDFRAAFGTIKK